jgi:phosphoglucosamine mutase
MIFNTFWPLGDGIISALLIIKLLAETNNTLANLTHDIKPFPERLINIRNVKPSIIDVDEFINKFDKISSKIKSEGKVLLRPSGTEPVIRLYASHPDQKILNLFINNAISLFESFGGSL